MVAPDFSSINNSSLMQYGDNLYKDGKPLNNNVGSKPRSTSFSPTFKPSPATTSLLTSTLNKLGLAGNLALGTYIGVDYAKFAYVKKLLENPNWTPTESLRVNNPEQYEYAMKVINNRVAENNRLNLEKQQNEFNTNLSNNIEFLGGVENISEDDISNIMRANLEPYPRLKEQLGEMLPQYSTPNPELPTNSSNVPYSPIPPTPDLPPNSSSSNNSGSQTALTLLDVLTINNEKMVNALTINNDKLVSALRGEAYVPASSGSKGEDTPTVTPEPFSEDAENKQPKVGIPFKDENGVMFVLDEDGHIRMTSNDYDHVQHRKDMEKVFSQRLNPRPVVGYEFDNKPHSPEYLKRVADEQALYDAKYGTAKEAEDIIKKYSIKPEIIEEVFKTSNIPLPTAPVVKNYKPTASSTPSSTPSTTPSTVNNISIERTPEEIELVRLQIAKENFEITSIQLDNLGDSIPETSPRMMKAIKNAVVAKKNSDENTFEVTEEDLDTLMPTFDVSTLLSYTSKVDRWSLAEEDYIASL